MVTAMPIFSTARLDIDDTLIGNADGDTLNGGAGNDKFVLQLNSGSHDTIGDFLSGADQILVDNGSSLIVGAAATIDLANFHTGDRDCAATWNSGTGKEFVFNAASHELWYSANGTGTDKIDLAHISTGVPVATDVRRAESHDDEIMNCETRLVIPARFCFLRKQSQ